MRLEAQDLSSGNVWWAERKQTQKKPQVPQAYFEMRKIIVLCYYEEISYLWVSPHRIIQTSLPEPPKPSEIRSENTLAPIYTCYGLKKY